MHKSKLAAKDLKYIWHPYTQMKEFSDEGGPIVIKEAKGVYLIDENNKKYLDAISSWWVNTIGHANKRLAKAIYKQATKLEQVIFADFSHKPAIDLAEQLLKLLPNSIDKIFYSDNGSTAVEVAIKMSFQYWQNKGMIKKQRICALEHAYHGDTVGSMSVGAVPLFHELFKPLLFDVQRIKAPTCDDCPKGKKRDNCNIECIEYVDEIFRNNHENISSFIIEPMVMAAGGMIIYPSAYLKLLRELCCKYNILLIADEVATGFGRTGRFFAMEHADVAADIYCMAKGITGGYLPLAVTAVNKDIYQAFLGSYSEGKTFFHGHSFTANPLACVAALEVLKIMKEQKLVQQVIKKSKYIKKKWEKLSQHKKVKNIRGIGFIWALDLVDVPQRVSRIVLKKSTDKGLFIRPLGNVLYIWLPLISNNKDIDFVIDTIKEVLDEI